MKAFFKAYDKQEKELFSEELEPQKLYILGRDPDSETYQLILIEREAGRETKRWPLPLNNRAVSRYDLSIEKEGSLHMVVWEDRKGINVELRSPSNTAYPVLIKPRNSETVFGAPLNDSLFLREISRADLYIYNTNSYNYIGSLVMW